MSGITTPQATTATTPAPEGQNTETPDNVSTAIEGAEAAAAAPAPAEDNKSVDDYTQQELENMSGEDLEALLNAAADTTDPNATPPAETTVPGGENTDPAAAPTVEGGDQVAAPADTVTGGEDPEGGAPASPDQPGIPPQRLAKEAEKRRTVEQENEELRAQLAEREKREAYEQGLKDANKQPEENPLQIIETNITNLDQTYRAEVIKLANQYKEGDLDPVEYEEAKFKVQDNYERIRGDFLQKHQEVYEQQTAPTPQQVEQRVATDPALNQHTESLAQANPWLGHLSDSQLHHLNTLATSALAQQGVGANNTDAVQYVTQVRSAMCQIGVEMGFDKLAPAPADPSAVPADPNKPDPGTVPTPEQRKEKLDLASQHPPHPTKGGVDAPTDVSNTIDYETITDAELASALPTSVLEKMVGL